MNSERKENNCQIDDFEVGTGVKIEPVNSDVSVCV
jgi:hypothetical protein